MRISSNVVEAKNKDIITLADISKKLGIGKSFFSYLGGKSYSANLIDYFTPPGTTYVDVFGGGGNVIYNINPFKFQKYIYNDKNFNVYNFFRVLRSKLAYKLIDLLALTPSSLTSFQESAQKIKNPNLTPLQRAYHFAVLLLLSRYSKLSSFACTVRQKETETLITKINKLPSKIFFLRRIALQNKDYQHFFRLFNDDDIFLYLDPPYPDSVTPSSDNYACKFTTEEHRQLLKLAIQSKCKIMISSYRNELYDAFLLKNGFEAFDYRRFVNCRVDIGNTVDKNTHECLYMNYDYLNANEQWQAIKKDRIKNRLNYYNYSSLVVDTLEEWEDVDFLEDESALLEPCDYSTYIANLVKEHAQFNASKKKKETQIKNKEKQIKAKEKTKKKTTEKIKEKTNEKTNNETAQQLTTQNHVEPYTLDQSNLDQGSELTPYLKRKVKKIKQKMNL
jgi:DNA adenine methylase